MHTPNTRSIRSDDWLPLGLPASQTPRFGYIIQLAASMKHGNAPFHVRHPFWILLIKNHRHGNECGFVSRQGIPRNQLVSNRFPIQQTSRSHRVSSKNKRTFSRGGLLLTPGKLGVICSDLMLRWFRIGTKKYMSRPYNPMQPSKSIC